MRNLSDQFGSIARQSMADWLPSIEHRADFRLFRHLNVRQYRRQNWLSTASSSAVIDADREAASIL
jgi:hypothetical protein